MSFLEFIILVSKFLKMTCPCSLTFVTLFLTDPCLSIYISLRRALSSWIWLWVDLKLLSMEEIAPWWLLWRRVFEKSAMLLARESNRDLSCCMPYRFFSTCGISSTRSRRGSKALCWLWTRDRLDSSISSLLRKFWVVLPIEMAGSGPSLILLKFKT